MLINFIFFWLSLINFQNTGNLIIEFDTTLNQGNLLVYIYDNPEGFPTKPQKAFFDQNRSLSKYQSNKNKQCPTVPMPLC